MWVPQGYYTSTGLHTVPTIASADRSLDVVKSREHRFPVALKWEGDTVDHMSGDG